MSFSTQAAKFWGWCLCRQLIVHSLFWKMSLEYWSKSLETALIAGWYVFFVISVPVLYALVLNDQGSLNLLGLYHCHEVTILALV